MRKVFMLYIVGMSGSGKTTIAEALSKRLREEGMKDFQVIDGDVLRQQFGDIFGYTYEERMKCNQVVRVVIQYLIQNEISVILSQVAAYESMREKVREQFGEAYIEAYIKCSYEERAKRDVKGYYKKLESKEISYLNGVDDVYEVPMNSHIVIDTEKESVSDGVEKIIHYLKEHGYAI